jgi:hypothetical protein
MPLSNQELARIKSMTDDDLVRGAQTEDLAVVVEANLRLKRATTRLTWVLIVLTVILVLIAGSGRLKGAPAWCCGVPLSAAASCSKPSSRQEAAIAAMRQ